MQRHPVNISASPSPDAIALGYTERVFNRLIVRISQYLLEHDYSLIFGHDWRPDGVMRSVYEYACRTTHTIGTSGYESRMINIIPDEMPTDELRRIARESRGLLDIKTSHELIKAQPDLATFADAAVDNQTINLWLLRIVLTRSLCNPLGARICLGGKLTGYTGAFPGIVEEAHFALRHNVPLYLLGGFGGAAQWVYECLHEENPYGKLTGDFGECMQTKALAPEFGLVRFEFLHSKTLGSGVAMLAANNGLSEGDNRTLAETLDIELALSLISKGLQARLKPFPNNV